MFHFCRQIPRPFLLSFLAVRSLDSTFAAAMSPGMPQKKLYYFPCKLEK